MQVYIYRAALYCEECGDAIGERLIGEGKAPANPADESSFDSDHFPKGPYPDGGGEADCAAHCDKCGVFLENALTADGERNVIGVLALWDGDPYTLSEWRDHYEYLAARIVARTAELLNADHTIMMRAFSDAIDALSECNYSENDNGALLGRLRAIDAALPAGADNAESA